MSYSEIGSSRTSEIRHLLSLVPLFSTERCYNNLCRLRDQAPLIQSGMHPSRCQARTAFDAARLQLFCALDVQLYSSAGGTTKSFSVYSETLPRPYRDLTRHEALQNPKSGSGGYLPIDSPLTLSEDATFDKWRPKLLLTARFAAFLYSSFKFG